MLSFITRKKSVKQWQLNRLEEVKPHTQRAI